MLLWILIIIAVLLFLLTRLRLGVQIQISGSPAASTVALRLGPVRLRLFPGKKKKTRKPKRPEKPKKAKEKPAGERKKLPKLTLPDIRDAIRRIGPPLKRSLLRLGKGIRIHPLQLGIVLGGLAEPADTAQLYGKLQSAVWTFMPMAEQLLDIPEPGIHTGLNFETTETAVTADVGVTLRVGTLLAVALDTGFAALGWLMAWQRRGRQAQPADGKAPETAAGTAPAEPAAKSESVPDAAGHADRRDESPAGKGEDYGTAGTVEQHHAVHHGKNP